MEITARQQEIVNEAIKIIAREGYQELTTKNLAEKVGVSEAALYRHFESKAAIIHKALEYFQEVAESAFSEIHESQKNPLLQIKAFVLNRYKLFTENPELAKVMFTEELYMNDRSLAEHNLSIMHLHRDRLLASIQQAKQKGQIQLDLDATQLFRIIIGSMRLLVTQWNLCNGSFSLIEEGNQLWKTIEKLIIKEQ